MAELVVWTDALSVGVQELDDQHKTLIAMLNSLAEAIESGTSQHVRIGVFNKLFEYTQVHFAAEEKMMHSARYPEYEEHKQEHETLVAQVVQFREKLASDQSLASTEFLMFLRKWLTNHIMKSDKAYEKHLRNPGKERSWIRRYFLDRFWSR